MSVNETYLKSVFSEAGFELSEERCQAFVRYHELLVKKNEVMNLTAITAFEEVSVKHFVDSCMLFSPMIAERAEKCGAVFSGKCSLIDIGTGAGFPGIPLKIIRPETEVMLLDALQKRVGFLQEVIGELGLQGISAVHARAEEGVALKKADGTPFRESFDLAASRAVAGLPLLLEYCLPFVKVGGVFTAYKSGDVDGERAAAANALRILGGEIIGIEKFELPRDGGSRSIIFVKKVRETPEKYPRKAGKPAKSPL